ncbi:hypothetical protein SAMN05192559_101625 [Halobacillus karajensis]|uniref:hypothetical protein n=1 Tax=Halobacillus karajensis TaxID=195088 RepID=UPI0008A79890|nr:hypothetical protein [Halobacillus karajensis]SEH46991.1 hypothetical protein SAMN05192559_101625 [Halobacillus karajensis]
MENIHTIWLDDKSVHGIIKVHDSIFEFLFHPIVFDELIGEFQIINKLWYTTYHGAREYFRSPTNAYYVAGRMKIHSERELPQHISSESLINV